MKFKNFVERKFEVGKIECVISFIYFSLIFYLWGEMQKSSRRC